MHTDVKVYRGYLVKETGGKLLRCSRVTKRTKRRRTHFDKYTGCLRKIGRRIISFLSFPVLIKINEVKKKKKEKKKLLRRNEKLISQNFV